MFRIHLKPAPPRNHREAFMTPGEAAKLATLLDHPVVGRKAFLQPMGAALSTAMGTDEIDALVTAVEAGFKKLSR